MVNQAFQSPAGLGADDIVGFSFQNAGKATLGAGIATLGQVFQAGDLPAGAALTARIGEVVVPVQVDVKTTHPDGSARMVVLSLERPELVAGATADVILSRGGPSTGPALDMVTVLEGHSFVVDLDLSTGSDVRVDVVEALRAALATGTASFWQQGALATQARVEVPVGGSMRMVFDVTTYEGGGFSVEAQFNNDGAMAAQGGQVSYALTATMDGQTVASEQVSQGQYQNWHRSFSSGTDGGQGLGASNSGWLNIRHDVSYLEGTGAVPNYDQTVTLKGETFQGWADALASSSWGDPLAANGVRQYMPGVGAREDIGVTTASNAAWLMTGDAVAAARAMGQAEAAGAVPWNFWDAEHGTWLNTNNYENLWTDPRGGTGRAGDPSSKGLTQQVSTKTGWTADSAHQPNLSYVPYLMTGERWILDNLTAQATSNVMNVWPTTRTDNDMVVVNKVQVRGGAWSLREIDQAAWAAPDGSAEKAYLLSVSDANWKWLVSQIPAWTAMQGEAYGWVPSVNGTQSVAPWQQDYFASTTIAAAARGNADAMTFLEWQSNFLVGRFQHGAEGFAMHDGAAYHIVTGNTATGEVYKTWARIGAATVAMGWSNGTGWAESQGDYGKLALQTLASLHHLTGSAEVKGVYEALLAARAPFTSMLGFAGDPQQAITIADSYDKLAWGSGVPTSSPPSGGPSEGTTGSGGTSGGSPAPVSPGGATAWNDTITYSAVVNGATVDLLTGSDRLTLSSAGANRLTVRNVETIIGGTADDAVTLGTALIGGVVDLGGGNDTLVLSSAGANKITVSGVETILGGTAADDVTLGKALLNGTVDLGGGADKLVLSSIGMNVVTVSNVETLVGSATADIVTLGNAVTNWTVDLGGGTDTLTLSSGGANQLYALSVETILGGTAADDVTLRAALLGGVMDLGNGTDRLALSSTGSNRVTVSNVETIVGGTAADLVTLATAGRTSVDLGGGSDVLTLSSTGANTLTVSNVETVTGGTAADTVTFGAAILGAVVDLGAGLDRLVLSSTGPNRVSVANVETITGGTAADEVTLRTALLNGSVDLGGGLDRLTLSSLGMNILRVSNVETIVGASLQDTIVLGTSLNSGTIDLGFSVDTVYLSSAGPNTVTMSNVENIFGGSAADQVTLARALTYGVVDLGGGVDRLVLSSVGDNDLRVTNVETIVGASTNDRIVVTGAATRIEGWAGRDVLIGGAGADTIVGGAGTDVMTGGGGADRFIFTGISDAPGGAADRITDFDATTDLLVFQGGLLRGNFDFRGAADFTARGVSEARFVDATDQLYVDTNGDGRIDMQITLEGVSLASLSKADFLWTA